MQIESHPSADLLGRFAAGALPLAAALVLECHLEVCGHCAGNVSGLEHDHGRALSRLPNAPMRADALETALARLAEPSTPAPPAVVGDVALPSALARQGLHARRFIGADYWVAPVKRARRDSWRAYVLRAPAMTEIPAHRHLGQEYFQVLTGAVVDGGLHRTGDFVGGSAGADHALRVTDDGPCACLIAVEHGSHWRGAMRLLSPLLGV